MPTNAFLSTHDQSRLDSAITQLLADGLLWRENDSDRRAYNDLARWRDLATAQLHSKGWDLTYNEATEIFQALHRRNKHRRSLKRDTALTLLVCRLLYVETSVALTPYPVITLASLSRRCAEFSFQPDLSTSLPELVTLKLLRPAGGKTLRPTDPDQLIELLPTLTIVVPDSAIEQPVISQQPTAISNQPSAISP